MLKDDSFYTRLMLSLYPDGRSDLLKIFYAAVHISKDSSPVLHAFLRAMYQATAGRQISMRYFASVMSNVVLELRQFLPLAKMFGGFLTDIQPISKPRFTAVWFFLLPLVIPPLLSDDAVLIPTSQLVVSMLLVLNQFPLDWGSSRKWRKCYKAILTTLLLIVHDSPRFVARFCYDFLSATPLHFPRLRNIILSCRPIETTLPDPLALKKLIPLFDSALGSQRLNFEPISQIFGDRRQSPFLGVGEIDFFLMYAFSTRVRGDFDERAIPNHVIGQFVQCVLKVAQSVRNACVVVEGLLDQLRFDPQKTTFFISLVLFLGGLDLCWDGVSLRDIIFAVVIARTEMIEPVPAGAALLRDKLMEIEGFKNLVANYQANHLTN
jgi:hypothetical protein